MTAQVQRVNVKGRDDPPNLLDRTVVAIIVMGVDL